MNGDNFLARLVAVFTAPGKAMDAVRERPRWLVASLILFFSFALFSALTTHISGPEQLEFMRDSRLGQMMEEGDWQEQYNESLEPDLMKRIQTGAFGGLGVWIFTVFFSLILLFSSKLAGGGATFGRILGVEFWASAIMAVGVLIKIPLILAKESVADVTISLAALLPDAAPTDFLFSFLSTFTEVFSLWALVVAIIGIGRVNGWGGGKATAVVLVPWLLFTGVGFMISRLFV